MISKSPLAIVAGLLLLALAALAWVLFEPSPAGCAPRPPLTSTPQALPLAASLQQEREAPGTRPFPAGSGSSERVPPSGAAGDGPASADAAARSDSRDAPALAPVPAPTPPLLPVVLVAPDPGDFTPDQLHALQLLRDEFSTTIRDSGLDPKSPGYAAFWAQCQSDFNERFRAQFGEAAFMKYQDLAGRPAAR